MYPNPAGERGSGRQVSTKGQEDMDRFNALSMGRKLILGAGLLLFIDTFLNWQSVSTPLGSYGQNGWHGFWGVLIGLMTLAILSLVAGRAFGIAIPPTVPDGLVTLALGGLIVLFAIIKALSDSYTAWPAYAGIVLGAGVAAGAWLNFQDSGEALPNFSAMGGSAAAPPAAPVAPSEPPADSSEES
jgi:hypothetical protein